MQIREKEEADWSIADRAARPDSYLVKAAARAKPTGQKALIPEKEDLDTSELFCGYSVKQLRDLQEAESELKIVKHWPKMVKPLLGRGCKMLGRAGICGLTCNI